MAGERVNLGQRLHHETRVKVIDEVPHAIDGVVPRAVRILVVENEVEVAFGGFRYASLAQQLSRRWSAEMRDRRRR